MCTDFPLGNQLTCYILSPQPNDVASEPGEITICCSNSLVLRPSPRPFFFEGEEEKGLGWDWG